MASADRVHDDGVRIRGEHISPGDGPDGERSALWVGHWDGSHHILAFREYGEYCDEEVLIDQEDVPKVIEALAERCRAGDEEQILERVVHALDLENSGDLVRTFGE